MPWVFDRSKWDTAQEHFFLGWTDAQRQQIFEAADTWFDRAGMRPVWNSRPPKSWVRRWEQDGIPLPPHRDKLTNAYTFPSGLRVQCWTLHNNNYKQLRSSSCGSLFAEEVTAGPSREAMEYSLATLRCGASPEFCAANHKHTAVLNGNPMEDEGHWIYQWLNEQEKKEADRVGEEARDDYGHLYRGTGNLIIVRSRTSDNAKFNGLDYEQQIRDTVDEDTAKRRLEGIITKTRTGRAYHKFTSENLWPIEYHPERTVLVYCDFNSNPAVFGLAHFLEPGEYPTTRGGTGLGIRHVGVFGEFFHLGKTDVAQLAEAILSGSRGSDGWMPSNWTGLKDHRGPVRLYEDATGQNESMHGESLATIFKNTILNALREKSRDARLTVCVPEKNPLVPARIRAVNAKFCSSSGIRSLWINPPLARHQTDFDAVVTTNDGQELQKYGQRGGSTKWHLTHMSDGLGYLISWEFPVGREIDRGTPERALPKFKRSPRLERPRV